MDFDRLIRHIKDLPHKPGRLVIIAISGFGGSGKSTLAQKLKRVLGEAQVVPIDDFIRGPKIERSDDWRTFDRERLRREVLDQARADGPIHYERYTSGEKVNGQGGETRTITPKRYLIVEGCGILHPTLMPYYDFSIWIDCPAQTAWARAKQRDIAQGNDDRKLWDEVWERNDQAYFDKFRPDRLASVQHKEDTTFDEAAHLAMQLIEG